MAESQTQVKSDRDEKDTDQRADDILLNYFDELLTDVEALPDEVPGQKTDEALCVDEVLCTDSKAVLKKPVVQEKSTPLSSTTKNIQVAPEQLASETPHQSSADTRVREYSRHEDNDQVHRGHIPSHVAVQPMVTQQKEAPVSTDDREALAVLEAKKREKLQTMLADPLLVAKVEEAVEQQKSLKPDPPPTVSEPTTPHENLPDEEASGALFQPHYDGINRHLDWAENGRPMWAQERFDALLFDVSGLTLAVPLIALGQIQNLSDNLTQVFGQSDWFMGLLTTPAGKIKTVNTALFIMPEKYDSSFVSAAKFVISIDGLPWGLAVNSVNQPITLDPHDVNWRTTRTKRPWLAGTVKSAMCALLDIPQMASLLAASEQGSKSKR